ncbi:MAG: hypothetical protein RR572_05975 [Raoultibacter sp.]
MKAQLKEMRNAYVILFSIAAIVAVLGRVGLLIMDARGLLTYDYIAASTGTLFNQVCTALTGPALFALMFTAGLVLSISLAGVLLYAYFATLRSNPAEWVNPKYALVWGLCTTLVAIVCGAIVASGILSAVQIASMKTKLVMDAGMALMGLTLLLAITTLLAAAMMVLCMCLARGKAKGHTGRHLIIATATCGAVVMVLTIFTFAPFNVVHLNGMACALWLGIDCLANILIMAVALRLAKGSAAH